jgi:hypothetical protein
VINSRRIRTALQLLLPRVRRGHVLNYLPNT